MLTKSKNRILTLYNKLIPSFWFGLHLLIMSVCTFVVLFNRRILPPVHHSEQILNRDKDSAARIQGEAYHNYKF